MTISISQTNLPWKVTLLSTTVLAFHLYLLTLDLQIAYECTLMRKTGFYYYYYRIYLTALKRCMKTITFKI